MNRLGGEAREERYTTPGGWEYGENLTTRKTDGKKRLSRKNCPR
jgi:hypothetical protein